MIFRPFLFALFEPLGLKFYQFLANAFGLPFFKAAFHIRWWGGGGTAQILHRLTSMLWVVGGGKTALWRKDWGNEILDGCGVK